MLCAKQVGLVTDRQYHFDHLPGAEGHAPFVRHFTANPSPTMPVAIGDDHSADVE